MIGKIKKILSLPKIKIEIVNKTNEKTILEMYKDFTKPHTKYKFFRNKSIGVMLYKLPKMVEEYEKQIAGKNGVGYFSRRCKKMEYYTNYFKQKDVLDEIYNINTSAENRQGKKMSEAYLKKVQPEEETSCSKWFGIYNKEKLLVGYINLIVTDNLCLINKILGHAEYTKDNIMHLILHDLMVDLIENNKDNDKDVFVMYDTYFGATEGLKLYKKKHCFEPYRVKWKYIGS